MTMRRKQEKEVADANLKLSEEVKLEIAQLDMKLACLLEEVPGVFHDEITLLTNISIKYF